MDNRHDLKTIWLHWLSAFLVLLLWSLGQCIDLVPSGFYKINVRSVHICLGVFLFVVMAYRSYWRLKLKAQTQLQPIFYLDWAEKFKLTFHQILYLSVFLTIFVGLVAVWYRGVNMFDLFKLQGVEDGNKYIRRLLVTVHAYLANGLMMAVLFHMVLAFWHHCVQKDSVLINMLPRQKTTE